MIPIIINVSPYFKIIFKFELNMFLNISDIISLIIVIVCIFSLKFTNIIVVVSVIPHVKIDTPINVKNLYILFKFNTKSNIKSIAIIINITCFILLIILFVFVIISLISISALECDNVVLYSSQT